MTIAKPTGESLSKAERLVLDRENVHGPAVGNMEAIAAAWSALFGVKIDPADVPLAMVMMKVIRERSAPNYDNIIDIEGYATILKMVRAKENMT